MPNFNKLEQELIHAIKSGSAKGADFDNLSLKVFAYQYDNNAPYRKYCQSKRASPENTSSWRNVPAVPTDAFKQHAYPLNACPPGEIKHTFQTSGTTTDIKGLHTFPSLTLYEESIISAWNLAQLPKPSQAIFLTPTAEQSPNSSLSHMMEVLNQQYCDQSHWGINPDGTLQLETIIEAINLSTQTNQPIALLGTALAFLHLFEQLPGPILLPPGSWAMETGGYKGTRRSLSKHELYSQFHQILGLPFKSVINEYSMTELSSQFYTSGIDQPHIAPPWTRIRVIDPITGTDSPAGEAGHLAIYDLANLHSVQAILTQDVAIAIDEQSFTLLGRDPSALPRGCSRAADAPLDTNS